MSKRDDYTAVILAAGRGSRIEDLTKDPKSLLEINGRSILKRNLESLENLGIPKVNVLVGYKREKIEDHLRDYAGGLNLSFHLNEDYDNKGNAYSMFLGLRASEENVLVFDGDLVYEQVILKRFLDNSDADGILVGECSIDNIECAKTLIDKEKGHIVKTVDKLALTQNELSEYRFIGEAIGILKFSDQGRKNNVWRTIP